MHGRRRSVGNSESVIQERWRQLTDRDRLFRYCLRRAADRELFVRKAIGWALRSYAGAEPEPVADFVAAHRAELSGLSRREAERGIAMGRANASVGDISSTDAAPTD